MNFENFGTSNAESLTCRFWMAIIITFFFLYLLLHVYQSRNYNVFVKSRHKLNNKLYSIKCVYVYIIWSRNLCLTCNRHTFIFCIVFSLLSAILYFFVICSYVIFIYFNEAIWCLVLTTCMTVKFIILLNFSHTSS